VLKLHAGDALTGDLYFTQSEGQADAALMNTVCFDAFTLGNHEFDGADAGLVKFIDYSRRRLQDAGAVGQ
jgi:5'-nucleotidase